MKAVLTLDFIEIVVIDVSVPGNQVVASALALGWNISEEAGLLYEFLEGFSLDLHRD